MMVRVMKNALNLTLAFLFAWFTFDMTGFALGGFDLVESPGIFSADFAWWIIFAVCSALYIFKQTAGKYVLAVFVFLWGVIQYFSHWYYTMFGVTEHKLTAYNRCFAKTYHIIPASNTVLIPDFYHIVLHFLIVALFVLLMIQIVSSKRNPKALACTNS